MSEEIAHQEFVRDLRPEQLATLLLSALSPVELGRLAEALDIAEPTLHSARADRRALALQLAGLAFGSPETCAAIVAYVRRVHNATAQTPLTQTPAAVDLCDLLDGRAFAQTTITCLLNENQALRAMGRSLLAQYQALKQIKDRARLAPAADQQPLPDGAGALLAILEMMFGEPVQIIASPQLAASGKVLVTGAQTGVHVVRLEVEEQLQLPADEPVTVIEEPPVSASPGSLLSGDAWTMLTPESLPEGEGQYPKVFHGEKLIFFGGHDRLDCEYRSIVEAFGADYSRYGRAADFTDGKIDEVVAEADAIILLNNALRDVGAIKIMAKARHQGRRCFTHYSVSPKSVGTFLHQLYREQKI